MNQLIVPISFTKIQFSKISSLWRRGEKSVGRLFPVESRFKPKENLYSRASFNCVWKIKHQTQRNNLSSKSLLVVFAATAAKTALNPAGKFDASLHCYLTQPSLSFSTIIEKFRWNWNDATWYGRQLTNSFTFVFTFTVGYFMG